MTPAEKRLYARDYYRKNRVKILKRAQNRRHDFPEYQKDYRKKNAKRLNVYFQSYYKKNRDQKIASAVDRAKNKRSLIRNWERDYYRKNPIKSIVKVHRRRLRKMGQGSFTEIEFVALKKLFDNRCVGCLKTERELNSLGRVIAPDHVVSLSHSGSDLHGCRGFISNIQPLCHGLGGCNNIKGSKIIDYRSSFRSRLKE